MRYLSIYKAAETHVPPTQAKMDAMGALMERFIKSGHLISTEGCLPSARGMRVRKDNGTVRVTDGPFTESKEVVGGFALLRADSKEEMIAKLMFLINSGAQRLAVSLNGVARNLAVVIDQAAKEGKFKEG